MFPMSNAMTYRFVYLRNLPFSTAIMRQDNLSNQISKDSKKLSLVPPQSVTPFPHYRIVETVLFENWSVML